MGEKSGERLSESVRLVGLQKRREKYSKETDSVKELRKYRVDSLLSNWGVLVRRAAESSLGSVARRIEAGNLKEVAGFLLVGADIDDMKKVNESGKYKVGDEVVVNAGRALSESFRPLTDTVGRYGGDEFVVVVPFESRESAEKVMEGEERVERIKKRVDEGLREIRSDHPELAEEAGGLSLDWRFVDRNKFLDVFRSSREKDGQDFLSGLFDLVSSKLVGKAEK